MVDEAKPAAPEAPATPDDGSISFTLRKPIMAHGDEVKTIKFRQPTAADIERFGNPVWLDFSAGDSVRTCFDEKKMIQMMAGLATIPPSSIRMMDPRDWNTCAW